MKYEPDYDFIHTNNDVLKERYLYLCDLSDLGYPILPRAIGSVKDIHNAVSIDKARQEKNPRNSICHMFVDDSKFMPLWNQPHKQLDTLKNFRYVCSPDFSSWCDMPMPLRHYSKYRDHALSWYLLMEGVNIIPTAMWNDEESYDWCFDAMPKNSIIAVSSNCCMNKEGKYYFKKGFEKMLDVLSPSEIVWVGKPIEVDCNAPIYYFESQGQIMTRKAKEKWERDQYICQDRKEDTNPL